MTANLNGKKPTDTLQELYRAKGELVTTIEVSQAKLKSVNEGIVKRINKLISSERNHD